MRPSRQTRSLGILQRGDAILSRPAQPFELPHERATAVRVLDQLRATMARVSEVHSFTAKGLGLAAPQIGIARAATMIWPNGIEDAPLSAAAQSTNHRMLGVH